MVTHVRPLSGVKPESQKLVKQGNVFDRNEQIAKPCNEHEMGGMMTEQSTIPCVAGVIGSTSRFRREGPGSNPRAALHAMIVKPIPFVAVKRLMEMNHYLHSLPGGTKLSFGVFLEDALLGAVAMGAGPANAHSMVRNATPDDCLVLTRLWLSDALPANSESRVIGVILRALRRCTNVRFVLSYADPAQGHVGTIYQACGWLYIGLSEPMPLYDLGDGRMRQSRSLAHGFGTHSVKHLFSKGVNVRVVRQVAKHRYIQFVDPSWRTRLKPSVLPYPKMTAAYETIGSNAKRTMPRAEAPGMLP